MGSPLATAAFIGDLPMALLLIEKGAVVDLGPLRFAIRGRRLDIVRVLLDSGGTVHKNTALLEAARHGYIDGLSLLLEKGADPNAGINEGKATDSALRAAVSSGSLEAVQTLLEKGADPNYGAPLVEAAQRGRMDMVGLLRAKRADEDCLRKTIPWLIQTGKVEEVRKILEEGVQVDKEQALDTAASYGRARIAEILVEGGADVKKGAPLVWAASSGNMETVNFFLNKGVDIHKKDQFDRTALRCADSGGFKKIKELLIERGAKE
jgi:ankyrin repeat protein